RGSLQGKALQTSQLRNSYDYYGLRRACIRTQQQHCGESQIVLLISMKQTHLRAASLALSLIACLLVGATLYANWLERRYVHVLVPAEFSQKYLGSALQRAAFDQPDLLPVYGSSEWYIQKPYQDPYRAVNIFRGEPTGFAVFPIGYGDTTDLLIL